MIPHTVERFNSINGSWWPVQEFPSKLSAMAGARTLRDVERHREHRSWMRLLYRVVPKDGPVKLYKPLPRKWYEQQANDPQGPFHFWEMKVLRCEFSMMQHRSGTQIREQWRYWRDCCLANVIGFSSK